MGLINFAALTAMIFATFGVINIAPVKAAQSQMLNAGVYRLDGRGQLRRLLVISDKDVAYDIWRATPGGTLEHLQFILILSSNTPIGSGDYVVKRGDDVCGHATLQMYRRDGQILKHPAIIFMTYGSTIPQVFGSFDERASTSNLELDAESVAYLSKLVQRAGFYQSLTSTQRDQLIAGVPVCNDSAH